MIRIHQILLAALLLLSLFTKAQKKEPVLLLKEGRVKTTYNITEGAVEHFNNNAVHHKDKTFAVLQFETLPTVETRNHLSKLGIELLEYIPENAYTVSITGKLNAGILKQAGARTLLQPTPKQKMHPAMAKGDIPAWAQKTKGRVDVWVSFPKTFTAGDVLQYLRDKKIEILSTEQQAYRIIALRLASSRLEELASLPFIEYVQPVPPEVKPLNMSSRTVSHANVLNASVADGGKGLNGDGVVIGIGDNGDVQSHTDLYGPRLINKVTAPAAIHGIHVHTTAAGAGIANEYYRGYASKATVISQYFAQILSHTEEYVQDHGMVLTNNSYGAGGSCGYYGIYDLTSRVLDQHAFDYPNLQHVFAAGNDGYNTCAPYPASYHTVFGAYQAAKNVITVGATEANGTMYWSSSRGPVQDGRLKPEITAQGGAVVSGTVNSGYGSFWGTSMASPAVTGGLALLYQRYRQLNGGANPKNGLMKALLCNGAADMGNTGPDFSYGYGWMNLVRSVEVLDNNQYFISSMTNNATNSHSITVPANTAQLKVMLYWNDPPAALMSSRSLVNDLDLGVSDPSLVTHLPKILDTSATRMLNVATTGADHLNNMEQVIINNPAPGTYTINISGLVAQNPSQEYYVVYDIVPVATTLTNPVGGQGVAPNESLRISWDSYGDPSNTFTLKYSTNNGATWTNINTAVSASARQLTWKVPNTPTNQALVRIERNGTSIAHTTQPFTIIGVPSLLLASVQCEGYISLSWGAVAGATDYEVMMKRDDEMVPVATTTATAYSLSGLSKDSVYWLSVRARIGGKPGRRSAAISRRPNNGTCVGTISDNDLKLDALVSPTTGRKFTSSELSGAHAITIRIKNLNDAPVTGFTAKYKLDNNAWISESVPATIAAGATYNHTFTAAVDLSATGSYTMVAVVENNTPDPVKANDTLVSVVRQLDNQPINLSTPFLDNLEGASVSTYAKDTIGLTGIDRYDFTNASAYGRLRTSVKDNVFSGAKALVLDAERYLNAPLPVLSVTGTFNLTGYNASSNDIRLAFKGRNGTGANANSKVWVRGDENQSWVEVYDYANLVNLTPSIEIADSLAKYGQNFSPSFQVKWSFVPQGASSDDFSGYGLALDDINIYEAFNDMQMLRIDTPVNLSCGLSSGVPLKVTIRNSSSNVLTNVPVRYSLNEAAWVTETIPSIPANTTVQYEFTTLLNFTASGFYTLKALVDFPGDNYRLNDTLVTTVHNAPLVDTFPYLQDFEDSNGGWYAMGINSSWQYGTLASYKINKAASGTKAWKTNLTGNYNDFEYSYLYSPCFDIGGMSHPTLSFSVAIDLENCGSTLCDAAWVEYTTDNRTWQRLADTASAGTNWYKNTAPSYWSIQDYTRWHVATIGLPRSVGRVRLRIVMFSDPAVNMEGIAIDDIHVYDSAKAIYNGPSPSVTATQSVSGTDWVHFESGGQLVASIKPNGQNLGNTDVQSFIHSGPARYSNQQYYHKRNITVKPQTTALTDSVTVRFYFLDSETEALIGAAGCSGCTKPGSAYELGVSKYSDANDSKENGSVCDNDMANNWSFIPSSGVRKVPFQKGYYAEFKVKDFSEFWLNGGGADKLSSLAEVTMPVLAQVCLNGADITLTATPAGGTWSGSGVSGDVFHPSDAGAGTHTLTYTYTTANGCSASANTTITVNPLSVIQMPALSAVCVDVESITLTANPAGGVWSGSGVSGSVFYPAIAGVGTHVITYAYSDINGCSATSTTEITVHPLPVITLPTLSSVCADGADITLTATPAGGTWSGSGVSGDVFHPSDAGAGTHTLTYSYTEAGGCSGTSTTTVTVHALPVITMPVLNTVQIDGASVALNATPAGGTWSGSGVSGNVFNPAAAGAGTHTLTYSYTTANGCSASAATTITVIQPAVRLLMFTAERVGRENVLVKWSSELEASVARYEIEVSRGEADLQAGRFVKIGEVAASGNTTSVENYSFMDREPDKFGIRKYRLKLVNADGYFTYSSEVTVEFPGAVTWQVYPNPSPGLFNLFVQLSTTDQLTAHVYDAKGILVKRYHVRGTGTLQKIVIDLSPPTFTSGVYMLHTVVNGKREFFKLHKL
jgi:hypothetical protein